MKFQPLLIGLLSLSLFYCTAPPQAGFAPTTQLEAQNLMTFAKENNIDNKYIKKADEHMHLAEILINEGEGEDGYFEARLAISMLKKGIAVSESKLAQQGIQAKENKLEQDKKSLAGLQKMLAEVKKKEASQ